MEFVEGVVGAVSNLILGEKGTKGEWDKENRYKSFSPEREGCHAKWFVDGKDYFYAVSEALMGAEKEIFIEDWWLSPELYLRRPPAKNEEYRLDRILKKKAEQGVKIYVVVYKEMPQALTLDSKHSKHALEDLSKNILVQRHPDHDLGGTFFWAHHEKMVVIDRKTAFIGGLDLCFGRYDTPAHQLADFHRSSKNYSIWPGQDYSNPRIKDFLNVSKWAQALIDKKNTARMPWHDVSIGLVGRPVLDVARHFIQRWNFIKKEKAENFPEYSVLIAKSDQQTDRESPPEVRTYEYGSKKVHRHPHKGKCNVQIIRSSAKWSHGLEEVEHSIQNAYIDIIKNSKHFIYIENQFFITATKESEDYPVKNLIGKAIVDRIVKAHKDKEQFRIIVAMPLLPAFPADLDSSDAGTVRLVMHYQYQSICRGGHSIIEVLKREGVENPDEYIRFYALRTYDRLDIKAIEKGLGVLKDEKEAEQTERSGPEPAVPQSPVDLDPTGFYITEELYIHSKLLIADDRFVICGSANLNDRSQTGDHDSEIAAVIEDKDYIDSRMGGNQWKAGRFSATLRRHIFKEHLGLLNEDDHEKVTPVCYPPPMTFDTFNDHELSELSKNDEKVIDPLSNEFTNLWQQTATVNTEIFRNVFHCVPDDTVSNWEDFKKFVPNKSKVLTGHVCEPEKLTKEQIKSDLGKVKGHLVHFPLKFMNKEKLSGSVVFDSVTPMELFT